MLYLGRGTSYPIALEGALKLKEISYIHAEGYAAGELKHGPIALIDETMPVIVIAPYDRVFEKTVSNMQEVAARGGRIILITDPKGAAEATVDALVDPDPAGNARDRDAAGLCGPGSAHRLPYGGDDGHGRGSAAKSGEIRHGRVGPLASARTGRLVRHTAVPHLRGMAGRRPVFRIVSGPGWVGEPKASGWDEYFGESGGEGRA